MLKKYNDAFKNNFGINPDFPKFSEEFNGFLIDQSCELKNAFFRIKPYFKGLAIFKNKTPFLPFFELNKKKIKKNFIILNEKSSFLFTCKRKVFSKSILKKKGKGPVFLVLNEKKEILGLSFLSKSGFENMANIGYYLDQDKLDDLIF